MPDPGDVHASCRRNLEIVLGVARRLAGEPRLEPLLRSIAEETCNLLGAERATLFLYDATRDELYSRVANHSEIDVIRIPASQGLAGHVARQKACLIVADAYADPRFNPVVDRTTGRRTRSMLAVPMTNLDGRLVGVLEAVNKRTGSFTTEDSTLLMALAAQAGVAVERTQLLEEHLSKLHLEREMELAREIQIGLLPQSPPSLSGFEMAGWSQPSQYAGGDFYDIFTWGDGRVGVMLGDAVGHGVGSALMAAETRALARALALREPDPAAVLRDANRLLAADMTEGRFVTLALVAVDGKAGTVTYASAGQAPIVLLGPGGQWRELLSTGLPLGIQEEAGIEAMPPLPLACGEALLIISDGIFECETAPGVELGVERVVRAALERLGGPAPGVLAALQSLTESVRLDGHFRDDRTAVLIKRTA
jgi:phosphoserine phosphatase